MVKKNCIENELSSYHKNKFRQLLLAKLAELVGDIGSMETNVLFGSSGGSYFPTHMADINSDSYEKDNAIELMESEKKLLYEVRKALRRLDRGVYGICQGDGEFIPRARLKAIPWARYCVSCANKMEKFGRKNSQKKKDYNFVSGFGEDDYDDDARAGNSYRNMLRDEAE